MYQFPRQSIVDLEDKSDAVPQVRYTTFGTLVHDIGALILSGDSDNILLVQDVSPETAEHISNERDRRTEIAMRRETARWAKKCEQKAAFCHIFFFVLSAIGVVGNEVGVVHASVHL